jgi:hypothetical protein
MVKHRQSLWLLSRIPDADSIVIFLILFTHALLNLGGYHSLSGSEWPHLVQNFYPNDSNFWKQLFYFHGNPPLLSVLHYLADKIDDNSGRSAFDFIFPVIHAASFVFFKRSRMSLDASLF